MVLSKYALYWILLIFESEFRSGLHYRRYESKARKQIKESGIESSTADQKSSLNLSIIFFLFLQIRNGIEYTQNLCARIFSL